MSDFVKMLALRTINKVQPGEIYKAGKEEVKRLLEKGAARIASEAETKAGEVVDAIGDAADDLDDKGEREAARAGEIFSALLSMPSQEDAPGSYTREGEPKTDALSKIVGYEVTAAERDAAVATLEADDAI